MKKLYRFYDKRGVSVDVEALTIIEAKKKLKDLGYEGFRLYTVLVL